MNENSFYILNFIMESVYLPIHLFFIIKLIKNKMPTPVWRWFTVLVSGLWGIVGGNFIETFLLLFWDNNIVYQIGVDYQLISTTVATMAFLIWNLYITGNIKTTENKKFRLFICLVCGLTVFVFCTNPLHGLFYEKLELGEQVVHGKLFFPCVIAVYGMLTAGWIISLINIIKSGDDKVKRIIYFSLYPLLPGIANLVRSLSGFTLIDLNPAVMSVCIFCLYSLAFKKGYVSVLPTSIMQALEQTNSVLFVVDASSGQITYSNKIAREMYSDAIAEIAESITKDTNTLEGRFAGFDLKVSVSSLDDRILVSATDVSEIKKYQKEILEQIGESLNLLKELEEKKRNIDAYLESLYEIPHLKEKKEMFTEAEEETKIAFEKMEANLNRALNIKENPEKFLRENLVISESTITKIRAAVALLKEETE